MLFELALSVGAGAPDGLLEVLRLELSRLFRKRINKMRSAPEGYRYIYIYVRV